jgi:uncharacterized protein YgiM (DUF1202 family)
LKKIFIMVLLFVLVLGGTLLAAEMTTAKVKVATANVRSKPDASAAIVAKVTMGTVLEVTGRDGAWYEVRETARRAPRCTQSQSAQGNCRRRHQTDGRFVDGQSESF